MLLEHVGKFNRFTPKFREELENQVKELGKLVRYRFFLEKPNPDPEKKDGPFVYPSLWTLDPVTIDVIDPHENRQGESRLKKVGIIELVGDNGEPARFTRIRVAAGHRGMAIFDLDNPSDFAKVMFLELHPKKKDGKYAGKGVVPMFERIDERKLSKEKNAERSVRLKALMTAEGMSEADIVQLAEALAWDSTQDIEVLKSLVFDLAENEPAYFNEVTEDKKAIEYRSIIKQALDKQVIGFDPLEWKFVWFKNQQTITVLQQVDGKGEIEQFATFLITGGEKADVLYKKIKSYLK